MFLCTIDFVGKQFLTLLDLFCFKSYSLTLTHKSLYSTY